MKKIILILFLFAFSETSFCQQTDSKGTLSKQDYLLKSKKQNTAAWILFGGGTGLATTGLVMGLADLGKAFGNAYVGGNESVNSDASVAIFLVGIGSMVGSIPLFIASGKNKRRAMAMSFKIETAPQFQKSSLVQKNTPSLNLKIGL